MAKKPTDDAARNSAAANRTASAFDPVKAALKQLYDDVAAEEIPDDFMQLLDSLDKQSKPKDAD